jgi:hypothetical protein
VATFLRQRTVLGLPGVSTPPLMTTYWDSTGAAIGLLATESVARVRAFLAAMAGSFPVNTAPAYNLVLDEIEETTGAIVNQVTAAAPAAITFTGSGTILPLQTQMLIRLQTATFIGGRRLQGRIFLPYRLASGSDSGGSPLSAYVTGLTTASGALGTTVVTATNQRVWSRPQPGRAGLSAPVIARTCQPSYAVLKSRRS